MRINRRPPLRLENFEDRLAPAIVLTIICNGVDLTITTDNTSTTVYLDGVANNSVEVFDDAVSLGTFPVSGKFTVVTGSGDDAVLFSLFGNTFTCSVNISTGDGDDEVDVQGGFL